MVSTCGGIVDAEGQTERRDDTTMFIFIAFGCELTRTKVGTCHVSRGSAVLPTDSKTCASIIDGRFTY